MRKQTGQTSLSSLLAVIISIIAALAILLIFILPAEFGKDPTGLGEKLGVTNMSVDGLETVNTNANDDVDVSASNALARLNSANIIDNSNNPDRIESSDHLTFATPVQFTEIDINVPGDGQLEYKFKLNKGDQINYHWSVNDGKLAYSDLHGHNPGSAETEDDDIDTKYLDSQEDQSVSGQFTAPFDGDHGWFFLNLQGEDITISLNVSGHWQGHELLPIESY